MTDQWMLDLAGQRLVGEGQEVALSAREFQLLAHDVYVRYLRRKLEPEPKKPCYITTTWGVGYRYVGPATGHRKAACD